MPSSKVTGLLSNKKLNVWEIFISLVPYVIGARQEMVVAIDWTDFDSDKQTTLAIHRVTRQGRATPLLWMSVSKRSLKRNRNRYEAELLHRLKVTLPNGVKVTVLADRGFGRSRTSTARDGGNADFAGAKICRVLRGTDASMHNEWVRYVTAR